MICQMVHWYLNRMPNKWLDCLRIILKKRQLCSLISKNMTRENVTLEVRLMPLLRLACMKQLKVNKRRKERITNKIQSSKRTSNCQRTWKIIFILLRPRQPRRTKKRNNKILSYFNLFNLKSLIIAIVVCLIMFLIISLSIKIIRVNLNQIVFINMDQLSCKKFLNS